MSGAGPFFKVEGIVDKLIVDRHGDADEIGGEDGDEERRRHVRFPLCLAVKYGIDVPESCADFILNLSRGGVFIKTSSPVPRGERLTMHFYIPPHEKLLGEFTGEVVAVNSSDPAYPLGMHVKFVDCDPEEMKKLEEYLEEKRHLVDKSV